jgi:hypothetical protein
MFTDWEGGDVSFVATGCSGLVEASPDGTQVICRGQGGGYSVLDIAQKAHAPLDLPPSIGPVASFHWAASGIVVFYQLLWQGMIHDIAAGSDQSIGPAFSFDEPLDVYSLDWAPDGRHVAFWSSFCAVLEGLFGCAKTQSRLNVLSVDTGQIWVAAVHSGTGGSLKFSPDSRRLAYAFGTGLYLVAVD